LIKTVPNKQIQISEKMTAGKMGETLCKFQNSGYCKYKEKCTFKHVTEKCETKCDRKTCQKRHLKMCKFGFVCRRKSICEYKHKGTSEEHGVNVQIKGLEATIKDLVEENKKSAAKMATLESELKSGLKKVVQENKEKDNIIETLKEQLKMEESRNKQQSQKLKEKDKEVIAMDTTIKMLKEKNKPEKKEESENKGKTVTQNLKCDQCHFGGIDQNDLKKHKDIKRKHN